MVRRTLRIAHLYRVLSNPYQTRPDGTTEQNQRMGVCASHCRELISKKVLRKCPCRSAIASYDAFRDILLTVLAIT